MFQQTNASIIQFNIAHGFLKRFPTSSLTVFVWATEKASHGVVLTASMLVLETFLYSFVYSSGLNQLSDSFYWPVFAAMDVEIVGHESLDGMADMIDIGVSVPKLEIIPKIEVSCESHSWQTAKQAFCHRGYNARVGVGVASLVPVLRGSCIQTLIDEIISVVCFFFCPHSDLWFQHTGCFLCSR